MRRREFITLIGGTPQDLTDLMIADIKKWTPIVQALHLDPQ